MAKSQEFSSTKIKTETLMRLKKIKEEQGTPIWMSIEKSVMAFFKFTKPKK
jgi:hypothetical protein